MTLISQLAAPDRASPPQSDGEARYRALLGEPTLVRGGAIEPVWVEGGAGLAFMERSGATPLIRLVETGTGRTRWTSDPATVAAAGGAISLNWSAGRLLLTAGAERWELDLADGQARALSPDAAGAIARAAPQATCPGYPTMFPPEMELPSPDGAWLLTLIDHDVWLRPAGAGEARRLTWDVAAEPRWSTQGAAWSPDGTHLALFRVDERKVARAPLVDWTAEGTPVRWHVHIEARSPLPLWDIQLISTATGAVTRIGGGDEDQYAFILGFCTDGARLRIARMERCAGAVEVLEHDIATGTSRVLLAEASDTYLYWPPTFLREGPPIRFLADGRFLWASERSGFNQLYLYGADGRLDRQLTDTAYPVTATIGIDEESGAVLFSAQPDPGRPYDTQLFRVGLAGGASVRLSQGPGLHAALPAPDMASYVEIDSAPDRAPRSRLRAADGRLLAELSQADASGLAAQGWRAPEAFVVRSADGDHNLHGLIYTPADFDPTRTYPVIEHIYAGPQKVHTPHGFGPGPSAAMAELGYVVVMVDGRGTPGRGKAFQDVAVGQLGEFEISDHAGAIRQAAAARPWMDLSRVGIFGGSYGGYFAIRALIQAGDLYRSAVALTPAELGPQVMGPPVECYIGRPADHPGTYRRIANADKLAGVTGELLIISGTEDVNTPFAQTMLYAQALIEAGIVFDQLVMPGLNHLLLDAAGASGMGFALAAAMRHFRRTL